MVDWNFLLKKKKEKRGIMVERYATYRSIIGCRMVAGAKGPRTGLGCPGWSQPDAEDKGPPKGMACAAGSQPVLNSSLGWSSTFSLGRPLYGPRPLHPSFPRCSSTLSLSFSLVFPDDDDSPSFSFHRALTPPWDSFATTEGENSFGK